MVFWKLRMFNFKYLNKYDSKIKTNGNENSLIALQNSSCLVPLG